MHLVANNKILLKTGLNSKKTYYLNIMRSLKVVASGIVPSGSKLYLSVVFLTVTLWMLTSL